MNTIDKHLDSDEKIIFLFRPSRRAFAHLYFFHIVLLFVCIYLMAYFQESNRWFMLAAGVSALLPFISLIGKEIFIFSHRYALTNERVIYSKGIFTERFRSFNYYAITDTELYQSFWGKIVNTGTLRINTAGSGEENYEINFQNIAKPLEVKRKLNDLTPKKMHIGHMREGKKNHDKEKSDLVNKSEN